MKFAPQRTQEMKLLYEDEFARALSEDGSAASTYITPKAYYPSIYIMARFAKGSRALAISDRSGVAFPYNEMVKEWTGALVHTSEFEPKQPQLEPHPVGADPQGLLNARPARTEFPTAAFLRKANPFICADVGGNANIQVNQKGTGLVNGDYVRFGEVKAPILFGNTYTIGEIEQAFTLTNDITDTQNTINVTMTNYTFNIQSVLPLPGFIVIEKINED